MLLSSNQRVDSAPYTHIYFFRLPLKSLSLFHTRPSWDYLPLHPADWSSTATQPRGSLQPCSNQSKASSFTTCTPGRVRMKTGEREKRETGQREEGDQTLKPLGLGRMCNGVRGFGKERLRWQSAGSLPHRLVWRQGNGRKTGKTGEATDGGTRACKQEDSGFYNKNSWAGVV